jgi:hypothetical protein
MQKTIEINFSEGEKLDRIEFKGSISLKRLSFSEKNALDEDINDIRVTGGIPQIKVSTSKAKELGILRSLIPGKSALVKTTYFEDRITKNISPTSSPYELTLEGIRNLPVEVGEQIFAAFIELNTIPEKKEG